MKHGKRKAVLLAALALEPDKHLTYLEHYHGYIRTANLNLSVLTFMCDKCCNMMGNEHGPSAHALNWLQAEAGRVKALNASKRNSPDTLFGSCLATYKQCNQEEDPVANIRSVYSLVQAIEDDSPNSLQQWLLNMVTELYLKESITQDDMSAVCGIRGHIDAYIASCKKGGKTKRGKRAKAR